MCVDWSGVPGLFVTVNGEGITKHVMETCYRHISMAESNAAVSRKDATNTVTLPFPEGFLDQMDASYFQKYMVFKDVADYSHASTNTILAESRKQFAGTKLVLLRDGRVANVIKQ